jgi:hypothetical protein
MPPLVNAANTKADISVYGTSSLGQYQAITNFRSQMKMSRILRSEKAGRHRSSTVRLWTSGRRASHWGKCQAFETLVIYRSTLRAQFALYLAQSLELTLRPLRFWFPWQCSRGLCYVYSDVSFHFRHVVNAYIQACADVVLRQGEQHIHHSIGLHQLPLTHQLHQSWNWPLFHSIPFQIFCRLTQGIRRFRFSIS